MRVPVESCNQGSRLVAFVPCLVPWPIAPLLPRLTVLPGVLSLPSFPGSFRALTWPSLSIRLAFPGPFILFSFPLASLKPKTAAFFFPVHNHVPLGGFLYSADSVDCEYRSHTGRTSRGRLPPRYARKTPTRYFSFGFLCVSVGRNSRPLIWSSIFPLSHSRARTAFRYLDSLLLSPSLSSAFLPVRGGGGE